MKNLKTLLVSSLVAAFAVTCLSIFATSSFKPNQVKDIETIVHDYLVSNPEVLIEASKALREREMKKAHTKAETAIRKNVKELFTASEAPIMGNPKADITIVEFMDYQCGHCKTMTSVVKTILTNDPNVKFAYIELPIFGKSSDYAARAAIASAAQGNEKFASFHTALLSEKTALNDQKVMDIAKKTGLDITKLKSDMEQEVIKKQIRTNFRLAQEIGLLGTPAFIVGRSDGSKFQYIPGATNANALTVAIEALRKN